MIRFKILFILAAIGCWFSLAGNSTGAFFLQDVEQLEENAIRDAVEKVRRSIIRFEMIGGRNRVGGEVVANGPATGVAVSADGYVISAAFHFAQEPASIIAMLPNGQRAAAEIVARDFSRKTVLLKIQTADPLVIPSIARPADVRVGETVIAVGRVMDPMALNISTGIVSAVDRIWGRAVQTDAKISPANFGGPLLTLRGEMIGVLVPMNPDDEGELAGTQWYDSGIGFAVWASDLFLHLEDLKGGENLRKGLIGVSLQGSDLYADPAIVAFCQGSSPAGKAGVQPDDEIVEINGQSISRQAQMKHALGPLYENEIAYVTVDRNGQRIPFEIKLAGEIEPFVPPGLGLILERSPGKELAVRQVIENSAASQAGILPDDRIQAWGATDIVDQQDLRIRIASADLGSTIDLKILRASEVKQVAVTLEKRTAGLPPELEPVDAKRDVNRMDIKLAEVANRCIALVPKFVDNQPDPSLLVWIPRPGKLDPEEIEMIWKQPCADKNVILLVPESTDEKRWEPGDIEWIVNAIDTLAKQAPFDRNRVVVGGEQTGGSMASLIAFQKRDLFRGLVLLDSSLATRVSDISTSPVQPLMALLGSEKTESETMQATIERLQQAHVPVYLDPAVDAGGIRVWNADVLRWVNAVDRF